MTMEIELTQAEIDSYAPYHTDPYFLSGFEDYQRGRQRTMCTQFAQQAYDRGAECAMLRANRGFPGR